MKKVLKFMSLLLIVPVLGIGSLLTGCGKKEASIENILDDYNEMVFQYQTGKEDNSLANTENKLFTFTTPVAVNENTYNYFKNTAAPNDDAEEQNNKVTFKINLGNLAYTPSGGSEILKAAYTQLTKIYAPLLNYSNLYFQRYQNNFFAATEVDAEELYELREKLSNLSDKVSAFYSNLENRQSLADFLGRDTEIMRTKLHTFNSVYVDLIEANFEFVLKFCDIHKNYVLNADAVSKEATKDQIIAERYAYEAALKYAYGYFLDNIKANDKNGLCDSTKMDITKHEYVIYEANGNVATCDATPDDWVDNDNDGINDEIKDGDTIKTAKGKYYKVVYSFDLQNEISELMSKFIDNEGKLIEIKGTIKADKAPELKQAIARVDAFTKLYKTNMDSFDMYTYNLLRTDSEESLYDSMEEFRESLSSSDKARLKMIESYAEYDLQLLRGAIKAMF